MKYTLRIVEVLLVLLGLATISVFLFLLKPNWSPFQEQTFGSNVIPVATMVAAWTTLLVAYAAFRTIRSNREKESRDRKERLLNEIIEWAEDVASSFEPAEIPDLSDDKNATKSWPFLTNQRKKLNSLSLLGARGLATCIIAEKVNLKLVVENVSEKLEEIENLRVAEKVLSDYIGQNCRIQCVLENNHLVKEALKMGAEIIDVEET